MNGLALILAAALSGAPAPEALQLERVAMVMRHGVRPPTKALPVPRAVAPDPWPPWDVPFGHLTRHGAERVAELGRQARAAYAARGLLPAAGCPAPGAVVIVADSDQRTVATGEAYAEGLARDCRLPVTHKPEGEDDALFSPISAGVTDYDAARAARAVAARYPHGVEAAAEAQRGALRRLQAILAPACPTAAPCALAALPTTLAPPKAGARPRLEGALDHGSTAAQVLLLEYADGKPLSEVGWDRATAADVTRLSALHAAEFEVLARTPYVARRNVARIVPRLLEALDAPDARLTVLVGHDTNVASLAGLLGLHFAVEGFAPDDPAPGGALAFELLRDRRGARFVRAVYQAQTLEQLRSSAAAAPARQELTIPGCPAPCTLAKFEALATALLKDAGER